MKGIYRLAHIATGRSYIGSSVDILRRWSSHRRRLNAGTHINPKLQAAWKKYGAEAFAFAIIEEANDTESLLVREQYYLDTEKPHYNLAQHAGAPTRGRKISASRSAALSKTLTGRKHSKETRAQISAALSGRKKEPMPEATRAKIAETLRGHKVTPEQIAKQRASMAGYKHSDETKRKIGAAARVSTTEIMRDKSPLTIDDVIEIKRLRLIEGWKLSAIGQRYSLTPQAIGKIIAGKRWKD